ncbi:unnamed protein product, partial [Closterium sp. Naga37s-1]
DLLQPSCARLLSPPEPALAVGTRVASQGRRASTIIHCGSSSMENGKAVRALLAIVTVIAACLLQPSQAAVMASASVGLGVKMTLSGRPVTFKPPLFCAAIPATAADLQVVWQQPQPRKAASAPATGPCTTIQFFQSRGCSGKAIDTLVNGDESSKKLAKGVKSARCVIESTGPAIDTTTPSGDTPVTTPSSETPITAPSVPRVFTPFPF